MHGLGGDPRRSRRWDYPDWGGIVYPKRKTTSFYELGSLARYFDIVEINSTFYRPADPKAAAGWVKRVEHNPAFKFTAKLWKRFTHERASAWTAKEIDREPGSGHPFRLRAYAPAEGSADGAGLADILDAGFVFEDPFVGRSDSAHHFIDNARVQCWIDTPKSLRMEGQFVDGPHVCSIYAIDVVGHSGTAASYDVVDDDEVRGDRIASASKPVSSRRLRNSRAQAAIAFPMGTSGAGPRVAVGQPVP